MVLNNLSKLTIIIIFLIISFLMPYYHSHDHHSGYHDAGSEHYDGFEKYDIYSHKHNGFHLHLKEDFSGAGAAGQFQNKLKKTAAHFTASPALTYNKTFHAIHSFNGHPPESNFTRVFSGVSPPVC